MTFQRLATFRRRVRSHLARWSTGRGRIVALVIVVLEVAAGLPPSLAPREARGAQPNPRPNVLLVVADDMRADGLWAMPTLRRLAERGVTFSNAFATTPLCCPSRASILSGLYARNHGVLTNDLPLGGVERFDDRSTLATWVSAVGVRTGLAGRYLNGYDSRRVPPGWDWWFALWQVNENNGNYFDYNVTDNGRREHYGSEPAEYSTRVLAQQALAFLEQERERPFLLLLAPRAPHAPATPDPIDAGVFTNLEVPLPPSYNEADVSDKPAWVREFGRLSARQLDRLEAFRRRQFETLLGLDRAIGQLVEVLRGDGRLDNTWIIFTSDNGLTLGEHRLDDGKSCPYEECIRVPFVVIPPGGVAAGWEDGRLVANIDLAPTIAAALGTEPAGPVDGRSLLPLLGDPAAEWRDALALEQWRDDVDKRWVAVRTADRKYVRYANGDQELYDLAADPHELNSDANADSRAADKARLVARLDALLAAPPGQESATRR